VESFAEMMVHLVDKSDIDNSEKIDLIYNIYDFHDMWDTGFTKLRVFDILIKTGYFRLFDPSEHPDYEKYKDFFDALPESDEMYIYDNPIAGGTRDEKPTSYWFDYSYDAEKDEEKTLNKMCCEAGSSVWSYFAAEEKDPKKISLTGLLSRLTELAAVNEDVESMGELYYIAVYAFLDLKTDEDKQFLEKMKPVLLRDEVMAVLESLYLDYYIEETGRELEEETEEKTEHEPEEDEFLRNIIKEWYSFYFDWKKRQKPKETAERNMTRLLEDLPNLFYNGEVDTFFDQLKLLDTDFRSGLFFGRLYENITQEGHEKILAYDTEQTADEEIKTFVEDYKDWAENKNDSAYYSKKAYAALNTDPNMPAAQYYIQEGLKIDSENLILKLYEIHIFINYPDDEEGYPRSKEYIKILDEMIGSEIERTDLAAFAHNLKAGCLYLLNETENSKAEMKKAIGLAPEYQAVYDRFFDDENE
jgi:hypothetical protein